MQQEAGWSLPHALYVPTQSITFNEITDLSMRPIRRIPIPVE